MDLTEPSPGRGLRRATAWAALAAVALLTPCAPASADEYDDAERLFRTGRYDECARAADAAIGEGVTDDEWYLLKIEAERARGKDAEALATLEAGLRRFPASLELYRRGRDVFRENGRAAEAEEAWQRVEALFTANPRRYGSATDRVTLGRYLLDRGVDARKVLERFFDAALKDRPDLVDAHYASAELALRKQDDALAASTLAKAPKDAASDPRYHYLLALALSGGDRTRSDKALADALKLNPKHVDSLLLRADHLIDDERYAEAGELLQTALAVNPREPRAWAYRAVLAHLAHDAKSEETFHARALERWQANPEVDHLIGRKLSQKYRFAEGSASQRKALAVDPNYEPAKSQLCQDLLRLGDEEQGWKLADEIFGADAYNVLAFNLVNLRDKLKGFRTLKAEGLLVRMDPREADLYGDRVLDVLRRARATLSARYGATPPDPVVVEIFPQKKEFAVRTFGLPGAEGFLGVCFGRVVTANSPASQGEHPSNWEAVLWHEYCHSVTLTKTKNKMPRWLSEGISVYEEGRQDPAWRTPLNPKFHAMLLGDGLKPLSKLSAAFLGAESALHLQFAYFESALAVEFLVDRLGLDGMKGLLDDLGAGLTVNESLPSRSGVPLDRLDAEFLKFARGKADSAAPGASWDEPDLPRDADAKAVAEWLTKHPNNLAGLRILAARRVAEGDLKGAEEAFRKSQALDPSYVGPGNAYEGLAAVARQRRDAAAERAALEDLAARDGSADEAYPRLIELGEAAGDWKAVERNARRWLAVNPLVPAPHRALARAADALGETDAAIAACRALTQLDETDPAGVRYRLASLLDRAGRYQEAKRELLRALEEAPRYRDAQSLLLKLVGPAPAATAGAGGNVPQPPGDRR